MKQRLVFFLFLMLLLTATAPAQALKLFVINNDNAANTPEHVVSSSPVDQETVSGSPAAVTIMFSKAVRPDKSSIRVYDTFDRQLNDGSVTINATSMSATMPPLDPGHYRVRWQAQCACADDTRLEDIFHFTVK